MNCMECRKISPGGKMGKAPIEIALPDYSHADGNPSTTEGAYQNRPKGVKNAIREQFLLLGNFLTNNELL